MKYRKMQWILGLPSEKNDTLKVKNIFDLWEYLDKCTEAYLEPSRIS